MQNAAKTAARLHTLLARIFDKKPMIRGGTMWDQTNGCAKQYICSIDYYLIYFLSKSYQIFLDRALDTPVHGKDVVNGLNAVQKQY